MAAVLAAAAWTGLANVANASQSFFDNAGTAPYFSTYWTGTGPGPGANLYIQSGGTAYYGPIAGTNFVLAPGSVAGLTLQVSFGTLSITQSNQLGDGILVYGGAILQADTLGVINSPGLLSVGDSLNTPSFLNCYGVSQINVGFGSNIDPSLYVGNYGNGIVTQAQGAVGFVDVPELHVAAQAGSTGFYNLSGGTLNISYFAEVGGYNDAPGGTGAMNISGGTLNVTNSLSILDATSSITLSGGSIQSGSLADLGKFTQTGGTLNTGLASIVGSGSLSLTSGTITAATLRMSGGYYTQTNGVLNAGTADFSTAASYSFTGGTMNISGGSWTPQIQEYEALGYAWVISGPSSPVLNLQAGASAVIPQTVQKGGNTNAVESAAIGCYGGTGTVNVTGANSSLNSPTQLYVGVQGTGYLNISSNGSVNMSSGLFTYVGLSGTGSITVQTGGSFAANSLDIGDGGGVGSLAVAAQSPVLCRNDSYIGPNGTGTVTLGIPGQTDTGSTWTDNGTIYIGGEAGESFPLGNVAATFGTGTVYVYGGTTLTTEGLTTYNGSGTGGGNIYLAGGTINTGALTLATLSELNWNGGTLNLTSGSLTVGSGGILGSTLTLYSGRNLGVTGLGQSLTVTGALNLSGGSLVTGALTILPGASFNWSAGSLTLTGSSLTVGTRGTMGSALTLAAGQTLNITGPAQNLTITGTLNASEGTFYVPAIIQTAGTFIDTSPLMLAGTGGNAATCNLSGGTANLGTLNVAAGGTMIVNATGFNAAGINQSGGIFTDSGKLTLAGSGGNAVSFNLSGGTLTAASFNVSSGGSFHWTGGNLNLTGAGSNFGTMLTVPTGSTLSLNGMLSSPVTLSPGAILTLDANTGTGILVHSLNTITLSGNSSTAGQVNAVAISNHSNRQFVVTAGISFAGGTNAWLGTLDLADNDLDIQTGSMATITNQVKEGYNGGRWNGSGGIVSSSAAADPTHLTALGVIQNNQSGSALYTASNHFDGTTPGPGDILIKFTWYGDANLDGKVDGSDYARIDNGCLNKLTGWYNGDFNYDGIVNGSDYALIDNSFNTQGARLSASVASPTAQIAGTSTVPEPVCLGVLALASTALLSRRRLIT